MIRRVQGFIFTLLISLPAVLCAQEVYFTDTTYATCSSGSCHANTSEVTCRGCHWHAITKGTFEALPDKGKYVTGENMSFQINGGDREAHWSRVSLYDTNGTLLATTDNCNPNETNCTGINDLGTTSLSTTAPTAPGTYEYRASWIGHIADSNTSFVSGAIDAGSFGLGYRRTSIDSSHIENIIATSQFTVVRELSVSNVASENPVKVDDEVVFTVTVTNNTATAVTGVELHDTIPSQSTFVSATSSPEGNCANSGGAVSCTWDSLASNASVTAIITVKVTSSGNVQNLAYALGNSGAFNSGDINFDLTVESNKRKAFGSMDWLFIMIITLSLLLSRKIRFLK